MNGNGLIIFSLSSLGLGIVGFVIGSIRNESRARGRMYERMDEVKKEIKDDTVLKKVCDIQHKYTNEKLDHIIKKVDRLLLKNGLK